MNDTMNDPCMIPEQKTNSSEISKLVSPHSANITKDVMSVIEIVTVVFLDVISGEMMH